MQDKIVVSFYYSFLILNRYTILPVKDALDSTTKK